MVIPSGVLGPVYTRMLAGENVKNILSDVPFVYTATAFLGLKNTK